MSQRFRAIQRILGVIIVLSSLTKLPPGFLALVWNEQGTAPVFFGSFLVSLLIGIGLWLPVRNVNYDMRLRDGFLIVTMTWVFASLVSALPFVHGPPHLSYTDAIFEATSGLTTTGATVISGLDDLPRSVLFYRQLLQFLGGMGIVILAVAILPMLRIGGTQLFRAESTGPTKDTKLTPRIAETAKGLWGVYVVLTAGCGLALWQAGMAPWDSVIHAFSIMGLGGFSSRDASLGAFESLPIETVTIVFALLSGINYATHYLALVHRTPRPYGQDPELRWFFGVLAVTGLALFMPKTPMKPDLRFDWTGFGVLADAEEILGQCKAWEHVHWAPPAASRARALDIWAL